MLKAISVDINKRLNVLSSNENVFNQIKNVYQRALDDSGHQFQLFYDEGLKEEKSNSRSRRRRKIIWYNPPFCRSLKTNIGKEFLRIVSDSYPKNHNFIKYSIEIR